MPWIKRFLALCHFALGIFLLLGVLSYVVLRVYGLPHLLVNAPGQHLNATTLLILIFLLLPEMAFGAWMLVLGRWLWSGYQLLRSALLITHGVLLLISIFVIKWGFDAVKAAERSTAKGGGLLSPTSFFPFFIGVPLLVFALCSIVIALWAVPQHKKE